MKIYKFEYEGVVVEEQGENLIHAAQKLRLKGIKYYQQRKHKYRKALASLVLMTPEEFAQRFYKFK